MKQLEEEEARRWEPLPISSLPEAQPEDWLFNGFIAKGLITELVGIGKGGKTTFVAGGGY